jgi:hypothetical protein
MEKKTREKAKTLMKGMPTTLRGNITTYVPPSGLDRSTPEGLSETYFSIALEYRNDAKILHERDPQFGGLGKYLLACHALEVGLKSFLAKERLSEKELSRQPFGHDLTALYEEAVRRGLDLRVAHDVRATIDHANCYHYKFEEETEGEDDRVTIYYALRYDAGLKVLTSCGPLLEVISAILNEIDPARCRS